MLSLSGLWFLNGDRNKQCRIWQYTNGTALFMNENGSMAWGWVYANNKVYIPQWNNLVGTVSRDSRMIVWPDASYWNR